MTKFNYELDTNEKLKEELKNLALCRNDISKTEYLSRMLSLFSNEGINITLKELEITSVNNEYIKQNRLKVKLFGRGMAWFNTGKLQALHDAGEFVGMIQEKQGYYISCIEEIAWRKHFIDDEQFYKLGKEHENSEYGRYIMRLAGDDI